jgi:cysteine desulfurase
MQGTGIKMKNIYLDYAATTPTHEEVMAAMQPYYAEIFGNPSSLHKFGREARQAVDAARLQIAALLRARPEEVVFTSGGTESDNFALEGVAFANRERGNHILTSKIEHHAILECARFLETQGFEVTYLDVDATGLVDPEAVRKAITAKTVLVSIMYANNEIGTIQPISAIAQVIKEVNQKRTEHFKSKLSGVSFPVYLHTDAVQAAGALDLNVEKLGIDLLSLSAHKFYGPKGVGALYIKKGTRIKPFIHGGAQERNRRASTENVPAIVGMGRATEILMRDQENWVAHVQILRDKLRDGILTKIADSRLNGHATRRLPNNLNVTIKFVEGESMLLSLDMEGVACSTGSACSSGSLEPSHVLMALGLSHAEAHGSLRFTLGRHTTEEEIDYVLEILPKIIQRLRAMSPLYRKGAN